ncbi:MAG: DUF192 domain-containing protein [Treponema sp.]|jgi:uncharacterized membrane protein (UPF0127 family)|nr:DUF192 domain-containing protein [Treponema sp.]
MIFRILTSTVIIFVALNCAAQPIQFEKKTFILEKLEELEKADGYVTIQAEIARTEAQRTQGFMQRKNIPDGTGMLFIFEREQRLSFYMKNTLVPLSIAFIASDGRILEIHAMEALSLALTTSRRSARYALEVPQGWFDRVGIKEGDRLNLEPLQ